MGLEQGKAGLPWEGPNCFYLAPQPLLQLFVAGSGSQSQQPWNSNGEFILVEKLVKFWEGYREEGIARLALG